MSLFSGVHIDVIGIYNSFPVKITNLRVFLDMSGFKHRRSPKKVRRQIINEVSARYRNDLGAALLHFHSERNDLEDILR